MAQKTGKFRISFAESKAAPRSYEKDSIFIGRLVSSEIVLDHKTVSRIHAGINFRDGRYEIANLSTSSKITLNGRPLQPQKEDVLADGDTIQIGPFLLIVDLNEGELYLNIQSQIADRVPEKPIEAPPPPEMRETVIVLYPLENWRLLWYRKDAGGDQRCDAVQAFLLSAVLQDPNYLTISVYAEDFA